MATLDTINEDAMTRAESWRARPQSRLSCVAVEYGSASPLSPRLFQAKGFTPAEYGLVTSAYWIASGFTGVLFGWLAVRFSSRVVTAWSLIAAAPALFLLPLMDGAGAFVVALLAGGLTGGSHSLLIVMSQQLMPKSRGFASGTTLGFIFGTGAIGTLIIGALSDQYGLSSAFQVVAVVTVIAGIMSFFLQKDAG